MITARIITIRIVPVHTPALKIPPIAAQPARTNDKNTTMDTKADVLCIIFCLLMKVKGAKVMRKLYRLQHAILFENI